MLLKNGSFYLNHRFLFGDMRVRGGVIQAVSTRESLCPEAGEEVCDLENRRVIPGFFDIHTHGAVHVDVNAATPEGLEKISEFFLTQGTTSWLCSILTDTEDAVNRVIDSYLAWRKLPHRGAELEGIHLEGPFLAKEFKGAMPESLLREPDLSLVQRYQRRAGGAIRYLTVAPELSRAPEFISEVRKLGIQVSLGHSAADYETTERAISHGACAAAHTGNAMRLLHQREPGIFGAVLEEPDVFCEMICDGRHLHPGTVRFIMRMKGPRKVICITDSMMAAGLPDGPYKLGRNDVVVKNGDAVLASDGTRAGSTLTMKQAFSNLHRFTPYSMEEIVPAFTENPAKLLGLDQRIGYLRPGFAANFLVLEGWEPVRVMVRGTWGENRGAWQAVSRQPAAVSPAVRP